MPWSLVPSDEVEEATQLLASLQLWLGHSEAQPAEAEPRQQQGLLRDVAASTTTNVHIHVHAATNVLPTSPAAPALLEPAAQPSTALAAESTERAPAAEPAPPPPAGSPRASRHQETWAYAVWSIPESPSSRGVHVGGGDAWKALLPRLGGRYRYADGHRLRRYEDEASAIAGYEKEAEHRNAPVPAPVFYHPSSS